MTNLELAAKLNEVHDQLDADFLAANKKTDSWERENGFAHAIGTALGNITLMAIEAAYVDREVARPEPKVAA